MSWRYDSYNWQRCINEYGNRYDHRGEGAANGGSYHYSNQDGSYYYQNNDGSTYYSSPEGYRTYTAPYDNPRYYESSDSEEEEIQHYTPKPRARKSKQTTVKKTKGKVSKVKKTKAKNGKKKSRK